MFPTLKISVKDGYHMVLADLWEALDESDFPEDAFVPRDQFGRLVQLVTGDLIYRDGRGVYVDYLRCRLRPEPK